MARSKKGENKKIRLLKKKVNILRGVLIFVSIMCVFLLVIYFKYPKIKYKTVNKVVMDENIVFVGDSITYMYDLNKYYDGYNVVNNGIDGEFTWGVLDDLKDRIYKYNPSKVVLLIGTNDIYKNKSVDEISDNVDKIIKGIKTNRTYAEIYLVSLLPVNRTSDDIINLNMVKNRTNEMIMEINNKYQEIAKKYNITYIDLYSKLIDDDGNLKLDYTKEGLHLNDKGYKVITRVIKNVFDKLDNM